MTGAPGALVAADAWITRGRVRLCCLLLVATYAVATAVLVLSLRRGLDQFGKPLGADFIIFYSASTLALKGRAALAYVPSALVAVQRTLAAPPHGRFLWCYPPTFQLLVLPLALAPYRLSLLLWSVVTGGLYLAMTRLISRDRLGLLLALAFPAAYLNFSQGQNGFLTAALLGGGLLLLERRPLLAGALLGLLACKPHLGLLLPLLLAAGGRWRSLLSMALSAILLAAIATALFGPDAWLGFLTTLPIVGRNLAGGALPLAKVPTLFAALRLFGAPASAAMAAQVLFAAPFVVLAVLAWRRPGPLAPKAALAVLATLLLSPYLFDYDLVLLAIPLGVLLVRAQETPGFRGARILLALAFAAPLLLEELAWDLRVQLTPLVLALCFLAAWRMSSRSSERTHLRPAPPDSRRKPLVSPDEQARSPAA